MSWQLLLELSQRFGIASVVSGISALAGTQFPLPFERQSFPFFYAPLGALAGFSLGHLAAERLKTSSPWRVAGVIALVLAIGVASGIGYEAVLTTSLVPSPWVLTRLIALFVLAFVCFFFLVRMAGLTLDWRGR